MSKDKQIQDHEISTGVSLKDAQRKAKEIFETIVRPQIEKEATLSAEQKTITLSPQQKEYANCHSPY